MFKPARADHQHARVEQLALPGSSDVRQDDVARVPLDLDPAGTGAHRSRDRQLLFGDLAVTDEERPEHRRVAILQGQDEEPDVRVERDDVFRAVSIGLRRVSLGVRVRVVVAPCSQPRSSISRSIRSCSSASMRKVTLLTSMFVAVKTWTGTPSDVRRRSRRLHWGIRGALAPRSPCGRRRRALPSTSRGAHGPPNAVPLAGANPTNEVGYSRPRAFGSPGGAWDDTHEMKVAVVGHVEWITFARGPGAHRRGDRTCDGDVVGAGGGGAVSAVQLAKLAGSSELFTAFGGDGVGRRAREELSAARVHVHGEERSDPTRKALCFVDGDGERTITTLGPRLEARGSDGLAWDHLDDASAVYVTAGDADALHRARVARVMVVSAPSGRPRRVGRSSRRGGQERLGRPRALRPRGPGPRPARPRRADGGCGRWIVRSVGRRATSLRASPAPRPDHRHVRSG